MSANRRKLLFGAGLIGLFLAARPVIRQVWPLDPLEFDAAPLGFRRIAGGEVTATINPALIGLGDSAPRVDPGDVERVSADICAALFGPGPIAPDTVPIAYFSDYYCPICRVEALKLADRVAASQGALSLWFHELPLLGDASQMAAQAALAADLQGGYVAFQTRLMRSPLVPTARFVRKMALDAGLDPDRLIADMDGPVVAKRLATAAALAELFGFIGTPAMAVGRTVVLGRLTGRELDRLIARERADGPLLMC